MKAINVNKLTGAGCQFVFWVADWFALLNNKVGWLVGSGVWLRFGMIFKFLRSHASLLPRSRFLGADGRRPGEDSHRWRVHDRSLEG